MNIIACIILTGLKSTIGSLTYKDELLEQFPSLSDEVMRFLLFFKYSKLPHLLFRLQCVEINGTRYKKGGVVVLDMDLLPEFRVISDIIVFNTDEFYLACDVLFTHLFEHHLHSYLVSHDHIFTIVEQKDLYDNMTLSVYEISNSLYIQLKYQLVNKIM